MYKKDFDIKKFANFKKIYEKSLGKLLNREINVGYVVFAETLYNKTIHTQQELSDFVSCNKAHTSRTLLKMQANGLVKMINSNNSTISLTAKGEKFAEDCKKAREELNEKLLENINKKELEVFEKVANQILANAQAIETDI